MEWPKPIRIATAVKVGHTVPFSQPSASPENLRCTGIGGGGSAPPRRMSVRLHHAIMMTTITVVTCMMRRASSLDSWMPRVFRHQK